MTSSTPTYSDLPEKLQSGLEQLAADLTAAVGDDLLSVAVYGGIAKGEPFELGQTPVPVLVVLQDASVTFLAKISSVVQKANREFLAAPFLVSLHDLQTSTDIFPIKFLDMQTHHFLLAGRDVLSELEISTQHLRLRCEQELCNLMLRLRNVFLRNAGHDESLRQAVGQGVAPFMAALGAAVCLKTGLTPVLSAETADSAAKVLSLDRDTLERLLNFDASDSNVSSSALAELFNEFIGVVEQAANFVDGLDADLQSAQ